VRTDVPARSTILEELVQALVEMTNEWESDLVDGIDGETWFIRDLGMTSMDLVILVVELKARYDAHDVPFEDLFAPEGEYVSDLRVGDMAAFLDAQVAARRAGAMAP
jgi:acyl carrier protein